MTDETTPSPAEETEVSVEEANPPQPAPPPIPTAPQSDLETAYRLGTQEAEMQDVRDDLKSIKEALGTVAAGLGALASQQQQTEQKVEEVVEEVKPEKAEDPQVAKAGRCSWWERALGGKP